MVLCRSGRNDRIRRRPYGNNRPPAVPSFGVHIARTCRPPSFASRARLVLFGKRKVLLNICRFGVHCPAGVRSSWARSCVSCARATSSFPFFHLFPFFLVFGGAVPADTLATGRVTEKVHFKEKKEEDTTGRRRDRGAGGARCRFVMSSFSLYSGVGLFLFHRNDLSFFVSFFFGGASPTARPDESDDGARGKKHQAGP